MALSFGASCDHPPPVLGVLVTCRHYSFASVSPGLPNRGPGNSLCSVGVAHSNIAVARSGKASEHLYGWWVVSQRNGSRGQAETPRALWGRLLKRAREACGFTQVTLASHLGFDRSTLAGYETGKNVPSREVAEKGDALLQTGTQLTDMWDDIDWYPPEYPDWFQDRAEMDKKAVRLDVYQTG
nr:helix-turn-helix transcriptional regulator [Streptacidiphilus sp. P02-A3a]